jgi:protease I
MTDLTAREVVEKLHQYDDLPPFPKINIHFLATAPGNEHLLKFMTEKPDNPIRFKGKRIGIIATHGVEETEVSIPRKWFEARGAICHLVSPNHIEYAPAFGIQFPEIAKTHILAIQFTENAGWIPIDARIEEAAVEDYDAVYVPGGAWNPDQLRANLAVLSFLQKSSGDRQTLGRAVPRLAGLSKREADQWSEGDGLLADYGRHGQCGGHSVGPACGGRRERNHQPLYLRHPAICRCDCRSTYLNAKLKGDTK